MASAIVAIILRVENALEISPVFALDAQTGSDSEGNAGIDDFSQYASSWSSSLFHVTPINADFKSGCLADWSDRIDMQPLVLRNDCILSNF